MLVGYVAETRDASDMFVVRYGEKCAQFGGVDWYGGLSHRPYRFCQLVVGLEYVYDVFSCFVDVCWRGDG